MSYPTVQGRAVEGTPFREARVNLGPKFANSYYLFFLSGTSTPTNVYQNGTLTTPFSPIGRVTADSFGRFPAIYLDPSIIYRVQFFNSANVQQWQMDPYSSQLSTVGTSSLSAFGFQIAPTGEITLDAPKAGGTGVTLTLNAGALGSQALELIGTLAGNSALIVNNSVTTGAQTATFAASNKPGTATSAPAGWLPITCDGVQYYTPIWHGNPFSPYLSNPSAQGEVINASSVLFGGNGLTTPTNGTAMPSNWFTPVTIGVGAGYFIKITKTSGLSGLAFSAAQGAFTNIGASGLTISSNAQATITGTYQLSTSISGSPLVANGSITLSNNNGVQSPAYNGASPLLLGGDGTASLNGAATSNWFAPTTANTGSGYWINITQTGGSSGTTFTAANGVWTNITNGGLSIGISGGSGLTNATGTYIIAGDAGGVNQLGSGTITLISGFSGSTTLFTTSGSHPITIPTGASIMTLEAEGGGGGGGGNTGIVQGNGGSSGARCVSTYALTSANWGQTLTLTCGASIPSTGTNNNNGQTGNDSIVVANTFPGFTTMTAHGGGGGLASLGGANAGGTATGGNVTNQNGNTNSAQQTGAAGLVGTLINGLAGATGATIAGGVPHADTATTIGQGAVRFS